MAALPKTSYAFITSASLKRWVTSFAGWTLPDCTTLSSMGVVTVSTSRVVRVMLCAQSRSSWSCTGLPWTPTLAMRPPGATIDWQMSKVAGIPTASIATSTPAPPVSAITLSTAFPSELSTSLVAPNERATLRRFESRSTTMISAGE